MRTKILNLTLALLLFAVGATTTVQAGSNDECAIWLCLPGGFPSGCGAAKDAMMDRIRSFKSPLPSFTSCVVSPNVQGAAIDDTTMTHDYGHAALIKEHTVCTRKESVHAGRDASLECVETKTIPSHYKKGSMCRINWRTQEKTPAHCVASYRYIDVFMNGQMTGETHYWR